jgi:hypothetical protein
MLLNQKIGVEYPIRAIELFCPDFGWNNPPEMLMTIA